MVRPALDTQRGSSVAHNITAHNITAHNITAHNITAHNITAHNIIAVGRRGVRQFAPADR
jgi:hypothetical protein